MRRSAVGCQRSSVRGVILSVAKNLSFFIFLSILNPKPETRNSKLSLYIPHSAFLFAVIPANAGIQFFM
jgi:hypothetical protein